MKESVRKKSTTWIYVLVLVVLIAGVAYFGRNLYLAPTSSTVNGCNPQFDTEVVCATSHICRKGNPPSVEYKRAIDGQGTCPSGGFVLIPGGPGPDTDFQCDVAKYLADHNSRKEPLPCDTSICLNGASILHEARTANCCEAGYIRNCPEKRKGE